MKVSVPLKLHVYLVLLVSACQPRPVNTPGCAGQLWKICDGLELTRAILDACGQKPFRGTAVQVPCDMRSRERVKRDLPVGRSGHLKDWTLQLMTYDSERSGETDPAHQYEIDDYVTRSATSAVGEAGVIESPETVQREKRSSQNHWFTVLNNLHQKCCMDGCTDDDLMQLC